MSLMPACLLTADLQDKEQPTFSAVIDFWPPFGELLVMCLMLTCFAKRKAFCHSLVCVVQIQMQDALEAAVEIDDKGKLEQHLQANEAQACLLLLHQNLHTDDHS